MEFFDCYKKGEKMLCHEKFLSKAFRTKNCIRVQASVDLAVHFSHPIEIFIANNSENAIKCLWLNCIYDVCRLN